jgi:hypothetical protein
MDWSSHASKQEASGGWGLETVELYHEALDCKALYYD